LWPSFEGNPITQGHYILSLKARVLERVHTRNFVILGFVVFIQCQGVTDGQKDRQTNTSTIAVERKKSLFYRY